MSVRREKRVDPTTGKERQFWMVDVVYENADGTRSRRVRKVSPIQTRRGAEEYERQVREELLMGRYGRKEVPTFSEWFKGRFWSEWILGRKRKPCTVHSYENTYRLHLEKAFGHLRLDEIDVGVIARFRADLVKRNYNEKTINNFLTMVSKPLHYAVDVEIIPKAPKVGLFKVERPEMVWWEFEQYPRLLAAARAEGPEWYVAVCLAGEAGLRIGEVKALRWREDVDLIAGTITVNRQTRMGITGTPKGGTRRVVPMTSTLTGALKGLQVVRTGLVVRNLDGSAKSDGEADCAIQRICRRAGLPIRFWHVLRHTFGTHAAQFGVNPWKLQAWMGHKRIEETMRYVHVASSHMRPIPKPILEAGTGELDPDVRVLKMLGSRGNLTATQLRAVGAEEGN